MPAAVGAKVAETTTGVAAVLVVAVPNGPLEIGLDKSLFSLTIY